MSAPSETLSAADPVISLRRRHQDFLARIGGDPPSLEERQDFMAELQAAGRKISDSRRRSAVRNMLFYWAGDATTRGERAKDAPLPQLEEFSGEGSAGAEPASDVVAVPGDGQLAESTPDGSSRGLEAPQTSPQSMKTSGLGGILGSSPGKKEPEKAQSAAEAPNAGSPAHVPLSDIEEMARARIILRYSGYARQWKLAEPAKQADYLLKGSPLAEASLYVKDDPDIRAHVEASEAARDAARNAENTLRSKQYKQRIGALSLLVIFAFSMVGALLWKSSQLQDALTEAERQRLEAQRQRQAAVDALNARDRADREKAAAFEVLEDPELRQRQSQRQQTIAPPTASNISETPRRPSPPAAKPEEVPVPALVAEPCSGYLWLGSPTDSRLLNGQSPATVKPGDKVTISLGNDIRLRETPPSFNYQMGRQNGLVPAGSTVTIDSVLAPIPRPSGPQYWAQVLAPRQFCTSVFVQFAGAMPAKLDMIKGELLNIGVQTPPAEELASARGKAEVRYYWTSDVPVAQQVAVALGKFTRDGKPLRLTPLTDFPPAAKAKTTTIEVWLDLDLLRP
jgi:hypothetical protein